MDNILKHKSILEVLLHSNNKTRKVLLRNLSHKQRKAIVELLVNICKGKLEVSKSSLSKLKKHKSKLRQLSTKCFSEKRKKIINANSKYTKKLIEQSGGFLPLAIAPLLALAGKAALGGIVSAGAGYATKKAIDAATSESK